MFERQTSRRALESRRYTRNLIEVTRAFEQMEEGQRGKGIGRHEQATAHIIQHDPPRRVGGRSTTRAPPASGRVTIIDSRVVALTGTFIQSRQPRDGRRGALTTGIVSPVCLTTGPVLLSRPSPRRVFPAPRYRHGGFQLFVVAVSSRMCRCGVVPLKRPTSNCFGFRSNPNRDQQRNRIPRQDGAQDEESRPERSGSGTGPRSKSGVS
ncbi:hypothetical protein EVAR_95120_1 [Eumeta japonica]|uniref:Uncharacterized protein n=1 Tax=Eumeta variegata TaxID=151549 RepID=A0A4C1W686_EUMVA|nr:hypothetical protein EVAR_95120_1 [Eumeta japonica]